MKNQLTFPALLCLMLNTVMEENQRMYVLSLRQNIVVTFRYSFDSVTLVYMFQMIRKIIASIHYLEL